MALLSDVVFPAFSLFFPIFTRRSMCFTCCALLVIGTFAGSTKADSGTQSPPELLAAPTNQGQPEARPLPHPESATARPDVVTQKNEETSDALPSGSAGGNVWMIVKTAGALAIVVMLMLGAKGLIGKWGGANGRVRAPAGIVTMLARYPLGRKQSMLLVKVDRRILVLAQTPEGTSTLSEMTDAGDVASLLRSLREAEGDSFGGQLEELLKGKDAIKTARARRNSEGIGAAAAKTLLERIKNSSGARDTSASEHNDAVLRSARIEPASATTPKSDPEASKVRNRGGLLHEVRA